MDMKSLRLFTKQVERPSSSQPEPDLDGLAKLTEPKVRLRSKSASMIKINFYVKVLGKSYGTFTVYYLGFKD